MKNRNVQIPYELFFQLLQYFLMENYESEEIIRQGLERKLDTMVNRELYKKILEEAAKRGIKGKTLRNAKSELEVDSVKRGNQWYWVLPE